VVAGPASQVIKIAGRPVGPGHPCLIIAEAGVNHNGDMELAIQLVRAAVAAGADAVKFQSYKTDLLVTPDAAKADYQKRTTDASESQYQMLQRLELSPEMHRRLIDLCEEQGIIFLSSPFDHASVELLNELQIPAFKIPSGEITNLPLLAQVAEKGRPMIVSTGMAHLGEVETAVQSIIAAGNRDYILLQCTSNYPAATEDVNLRAMNTMAEAFGSLVGYSDHTLGIEIPLAAVAMGASVIEKHITLDVNMPGPDHAASLPPEEFASMVRGVRAVESAVGHGRKEPAERELATAEVARKSLVAARDIAGGETLTEQLMDLKRPGSGLSPAMRAELAGRTVKTPIKMGALITLDMLE